MMLNISSLDQYYGESQILWDVNLDVSKGSCLCLIGRNGVGKTTLLNCIMGLIPIRKGQIIFNGECLSSLKTEDRAAFGIGYVPQGRDIFPFLTVEENLKTGLRVAKKRNAKMILEEVFHIFPVLKQMLNRRGGDLSGGQQQQLAIARALVINPRLLILDEPTEGLQPSIVTQIGEIIMRLNTKGNAMLQPASENIISGNDFNEDIKKINRDLGITVLLVEQKLPFAKKVADQFCIMERGRTVANGCIDELNESLVQRHLRV